MESEWERRKEREEGEAKMRGEKRDRGGREEGKAIKGREKEVDERGKTGNRERKGNGEEKKMAKRRKTSGEKETGDRNEKKMRKKKRNEMEKGEKLLKGGKRVESLNSYG